MADFKPAFPYNTPAYILTPTFTTVKGVAKKSFNDPTEDDLIYCSFKTYGGTESLSNDVYTVLDTANVETWFRPDIKAGCKFLLADDMSKAYAVIGEPENINMRNQYLKFKVQRVAGGA